MNAMQTRRGFALTAAGRIVLGGALIYGFTALALSHYKSRAHRSAALASGPTAPAESDASLRERGKYLVTIGGCNDCHTPWTMTENGPQPDYSRMLSGHPQSLKITSPPKTDKDSPWVWHAAGTNTAFAGPWGITYTPNLTPDVNTGLGIWTEEMFIRALRTGKHFGESRPIQPPMPWFNYGLMTDADLKAVYAYLRSIPPVSNLVPDYRPPEE